MQWPLDTRFYVLYPLPKNQPQDQLAALLTDLKRRGFSRLYQNGQTFEYSRPESLLDIDFSQTVYVLVDRLKAAPDIRQRLIDSVEICFRENNGEVILEVLEAPHGNGLTPQEKQVRFTESFECKSAASGMKIRSRSCFLSTALSERAPGARDSATPSISI